MSFVSTIEREWPEADALQWRGTVLRLSHVIARAAAERPALAVVLMEAFDNALEQLLLFDCQSDLQALDEWLAHEMT